MNFAAKSKVVINEMIKSLSKQKDTMIKTNNDFRVQISAVPKARQEKLRQIHKSYTSFEANYADTIRNLTVFGSLLDSSNPIGSRKTKMDNAKIQQKGNMKRVQIRIEKFRHDLNLIHEIGVDRDQVARFKKDLIKLDKRCGASDTMVLFDLIRLSKIIEMDDFGNKMSCVQLNNYYYNLGKLLDRYPADSFLADID